MFNYTTLKDNYSRLELPRAKLSSEIKLIDAKNIDPSDLKYMRLASALSLPISYNLLTSTVASASGAGTFDGMYKAVISLFDGGVVLVLCFAGAAWGLGHRSKAIEIIIGASLGYVLARHAVDIRDFLATI